MKLQVLQENFSNALINASRFASSHAQLPVLGNIMLSTKKTKLFVSSTNLETSILIAVGAKIDQEGEITIPAKTLTEVISNLPSGTLDLESEKENVKIKAQGTNITISGMNSSDFPEIPKSIDTKTAIALPKEGFLNALSQVMFAVSIDETRPVLTGTLFLFEKGNITLVATDGFRLSQTKIPTSDKPKSFDRIILPKSVLSEASRLVGDDSEIYLNFKKDENQAIFGFTDTILASRIIDGEFPDFAKIIPKEKKVKISLDKDEILRAVKLAATFARDSANVVKLGVKKDEIEIFAESSSSGSQKTLVEAKIEGESIEIAFNYRFLEDFLVAVKGPEVTIELSDPSAPGVFSDPKDPNFLHLIMPVRIQE